MAANEHKWHFINQGTEPNHENEHVKVNNAAKFQSCWQKTRGTADLSKKKKENKIEVYGSKAWVDYHTFVSYFKVFRMSAVPHVFDQQLRAEAKLRVQQTYAHKHTRK